VHIDALGEIQEKEKSLVPVARELVAFFWAGVAARFCDARHLRSIVTSTASWSMARSTRAYLARETAVVSCELDAVHLLAAPTRHGSVWMRNSKLFAGEISKVLATLQYAVETSSSDEAGFLAAQILATVRDLQVSSSRAATAGATAEMPAAGASGDTSPGGDAKMSADVPSAAGKAPTELESVLDQAQVALKHALCGAFPSSLLLEAARATLDDKAVTCYGHPDLLPDDAAAALSAFRSMNAKGGVKRELWAWWIADLREAEEYCFRVSNPNLRSEPGMWMYRDRQLAALRRFGEVYAKRVPSSDLRAALESTPCLQAVVCGDERPPLWPHTVLCKQR
jgi:hypothetical protein